MITSQGLQKLGFKSLISNEDGDFLLEDAGAGTYIAQWKSASPQPTEAEIDTKLAEMIAEYTAQEYARNRASATGYPSIPDQLDEIYHNGIDSWKAVIKVTKDKYPKG